MRTIQRRARQVLLTAAGCAVLVLASVVAAPAVAIAGETLRPEVGKPLNDAQGLYRARKYKEALGKVAQAAAVPNKTAYEAYMVEQMRGAAAMAAGDTGTAAQAYEGLLSGGQLEGEDEQRVTATLAGVYFQQHNYARAITVAQRYLKAGGNDPQMRTLLVQSYYLSNDCASVVNLLKPGIDAQTKAGRAPDESQLQLLGTCAQRTKNDIAYRGALEALVAYHPKQSYWDDFFTALRHKPGFSSSLDIDNYRLRRAVGALTSVDDYMEMTQLALVAGSAAEAKQVIDQGFASGVLGHDPKTADREKRLQALAATRAAAGVDKANAPAPIDQGLNLVFAGQAQEGISMMEAALARGDLDRPDHAQLHLGIAYYVAGQRARAVQAFRAVKGSDGATELAWLWERVANRAH